MTLSRVAVVVLSGALAAACSTGSTSGPAEEGRVKDRDLAGAHFYPSDALFKDTLVASDLRFWPADATPDGPPILPNADARPDAPDGPTSAALADARPDAPPRPDAGDEPDVPPRPPLPDVGLRECRLNSDCPPGQYCGEERCTYDCREARDCALGQRCVNGECVAGAPDPDLGVGPPPFDCRRDGCLGTDLCNAETGACVAPVVPGNGELGAECMSDDDCNGTYCLGIGVAGVPHRFCTYLCCTEGECPIGMACGSGSGPKFCIPSEIFPNDAYSFDAVRGQSCGRGGAACQSMICDTGRDRCEQTCCTDADCGGLACVWQGNQAQICDIPLFGFGRTGDSCEFQFELDCMSMVCLLGPDGPVCADMCCSNLDCPGGSACQQVIGPGGDYISACAPTVRGEAFQGEGCASDAGCQSGLCIIGACVEPCCEDQDCPGGQRCDLADNGQDGYIRICR